MMKKSMMAAAVLLLTGVAAEAQSIPRGSYLRTCNDVERRGPYLYGVCQDMRGRWRETQLDLRGCNGPVANNNGRLVCSRGGGGGGYDDDEGYRPYPPRPRW